LSTGTLIGIDLGGTNVRAACILDDEIEEMTSEPISGKENAELLINQIKGMISNLWNSNIEAIGIGVPSVVDVEKGIVYDVQNIPSWKEVPLKEILEEEFGKPVFINNDANCFTLGEKYFGEAKNYKSVVGLILGTGFGSGLILNNILYSGNNCGAGEVGMLPYKDSIFEHYCSGQFFEIHKNTTGQELFSRAQKGDTEALEAYNEFGAHLGNAVKVVMYAYDPEVIVLGGSVSKAFSFFQESMFKAMEDFAYPNSIRNLKIKTTERKSVAVLGAAALVLDHQFLNN
jgi:glucokinase|tara:strand:- start:6846 stop:7706 length:861 start_codon:yes stop_codon:yes gene_type:complete